LRQLALKHFGDDLLVTSMGKNQHINCNAFKACEKQDLNASMISSASDILSLAMTDYQVC